MTLHDNFASKLSLLLSYDCADATYDWKLLGHEDDGTLLFTWKQYVLEDEIFTWRIGYYRSAEERIHVLFITAVELDCVQASIDSSKQYLLFVTKENGSTQAEYPKDNRDYYTIYLRHFNAESEESFYDLKTTSPKQIKGQFMSATRKKDMMSISFLVLVHNESITLYEFVKYKDIVHGAFRFMNHEVIVNQFIWAQWDEQFQTLYYIHTRGSNYLLQVPDDNGEAVDTTHSHFTLCGLQFHYNLPHENVLNIPLNLKLNPNAEPFYEDDPVPLRIHDSNLDLMVLTQDKGRVYVCHYYLYKPNGCHVDGQNDTDVEVNFTYSIIALHQSTVIECIVPAVNRQVAKVARPLFMLHHEHVLVFIPTICTHLLDLGSFHMPCCHIVMPPIIDGTPYLCSMLSNKETVVLNMTTMDVFQMAVSPQSLVKTFKTIPNFNNRMSILHYFILHKNEPNIVNELLYHAWVVPFEAGQCDIMREYLAANTYHAVTKTAHQDATNLFHLLPFTISESSWASDVSVNVGGYDVSISQKNLLNAPVMVLSPQQRLLSYNHDVWISLWEHLQNGNKDSRRFKYDHVTEKLRISLACFDGEELYQKSRSTSLISPSRQTTETSMLNDCLLTHARRRKTILPFSENEAFNANKQEHVMSVNLREINMHLLKESSEFVFNRYKTPLQTPIHVNSVSKLYASTQLDNSRILCQLICDYVIKDIPLIPHEGVPLINNLPTNRRYVLFVLLKSYLLAIQKLAFPLPKGFNEFFTYLGYKSLPYDIFIDNVTHHVFEVQPEVGRNIIFDFNERGMDPNKVLQMLTLLPRSRFFHLISFWCHPKGLKYQAEDLIYNILSGNEGSSRCRDKHRRIRHEGLIIEPSLEIQPFGSDTLMQLVDAKTNLHDFDRDLIIKAASYSVNNL